MLKRISAQRLKSSQAPLNILIQQVLLAECDADLALSSYIASRKL
jgi:hypothetical protein